LSKTKIRTF